MRTLALILGRSGSKGLPGKNLLPLAGRECVRWTIDAARSSTRVDRIALSSDSLEMLKIAGESGVDAIARPAQLASDTATVDDAARHAVETLDDAAIDVIVILYANVPVRPEGVIDQAIAMLRENKADSVQTYSPVGKHHPWWTARVGEGDGVVEAWDGGEVNHGVYRRQDLPPAYVPDGAVLVVTRDALFFKRMSGRVVGPHAFLGTDRRGVITAEGAVVDIDSEIDLLVAEAKLLAARAPVEHAR